MPVLRRDCIRVLRQFKDSFVRACGANLPASDLFEHVLIEARFVERFDPTLEHRSLIGEVSLLSREIALLLLQMHVGDQTLAPCYGVAGEIQNQGAKSEGERPGLKTGFHDVT